MERRVAALIRVSAVVVGAACGCGGNGTVNVDLVHANFDDPYRGIDRLHASVEDGSGNVIVERDFDPFGPSLELPELNPGNDRIIRIAGYSGTTLHSRGQSAPLSFVADGSQHIPVTFSTLPVAVALPVSAFAPGGITIDGNLDEWAGAPVAAELHPSNASYGTAKDDADLSADIYLAWNDRGLYIAMHVRDQ